jgi:hypothetical protein
MVFRVILLISLGSADPLQKPSLAMPRLRMRPRRGSPWHPRRPRTSSSPSGSSTPGLDCLAVWTPPGLQHGLLPCQALLLSSASRHRPRHNPKTPSTSLPREHSAILHDLVFELREGVNDLQFRVQQMEGRLSVLLQLLATPPPAAPEYSSEAPRLQWSASSQQHDSTEKVGRNPKGRQVIQGHDCSRAEGDFGKALKEGTNCSFGSGSQSEGQQHPGARRQEPQRHGHAVDRRDTCHRGTLAWPLARVCSRLYNACPIL